MRGLTDIARSRGIPEYGLRVSVRYGLTLPVVNGLQFVDSLAKISGWVLYFIYVYISYMFGLLVLLIVWLYYYVLIFSCLCLFMNMLAIPCIFGVSFWGTCYL